MVFLLALNLIIDSVCLFCYNYIFSPDIASIIKCTNMQEAKEYFNTYVSPMLSFGVCTVLCMFVIAYLLLKKLRPQISGIYVPAFFVMLTIAALFGTIIQGSKNWGNVSVTKLYQLLKQEAPPSLDEYFTQFFLKCIILENMLNYWLQIPTLPFYFSDTIKFFKFQF